MLKWIQLEGIIRFKSQLMNELYSNEDYHESCRRGVNIERDDQVVS